MTRRSGLLSITTIAISLGVIAFNCSRPHQPTWTFQSDSMTGVVHSWPDTISGPTGSARSLSGGAGNMKITSGIGPRDTVLFSGHVVDGAAMLSTQRELSITFVTSSKSVLTITPDGRFVLGPGATPDDAARAIVDIATKMFHDQEKSRCK